MIKPTGIVAMLLLAGFVLAGSPAPAQEPGDGGSSDPQSGPEPLDVGLVEKQVVAIAEFQILVTDWQGRAITDLGPHEIRVFEGGVEQRLAFVEQVSGGRIGPSGAFETQAPAALYSAEGEHRPGDTIDVLPPKAVRRVVLAFDVRNSKKSVRKNWLEAARGWLDGQMREGDLVGIVRLGAYPEWLVDFTGDPQELLSALAEVSLKKGALNRDTQRDTSVLMREMADCAEADAGRVGGGNAVQCSYNVARAYVRKWQQAAEESAQNLRVLAGQLAAVPGRKAVLLFTEGIVEDASMMAVSAFLGYFGDPDSSADIHKIKVRLLNQDVYAHMSEVQRLARQAGVTFFALDTKQGAPRGFGGDLEQGGPRPVQTQGHNPWSDIDESTSRAVDLLSRETGGRSYEGLQNLDDNLRAAADSFFGMYTVGYYRADPELKPGKLRLEIDREKIDVQYRKHADVAAAGPETASLDLAIGQPRPGEGGDGQTLPVSVIMAFDELPLRGSRANRGTVLGLHVEAIRPDGTIVAERLDVEVIEIAEDQQDDVAGTRYVHHTELTLPPGPYRIRARVSDDRQLLVAERAVDLTLDAETVRPGLH